MDIAALIDRLKLQPLPEEGGFYRETYRAAEVIPADVLPPRYTTDKAHSTAIYYLLTPDTCSALHRLPTDEIFHFYAGDPVEMLHLYPDGTARRIVVHNSLAPNTTPQVVVPAGTWQGARLRDGGQFALMGTTMAPGFDFADFEAADPVHLGTLYPAYADFIKALTPE